MKINEMFTSNIRRTASGYALRGLTLNSFVKALSASLLLKRSLFGRAYSIVNSAAVKYIAVRPTSYSKMKIKLADPLILSKVILFCALVFNSSFTSASYREAIDALYEGDGAKVMMLLDKVVDKKHDEGVHLFISHLYFQRYKHTFSTEYKKSQTELRKGQVFSYATLFTDQEAELLYDLLNARIQHIPKNDSYFESRATLIRLAKILKKDKSEGFGEKWQQLATSAAGKLRDPSLIEYIAAVNYRSCGESVFSQFDCLKLAAELGEPYAQSVLGHVYLGETAHDSVYTSRKLDNVPVDLVKANYWLEQSIRNATFPQSPEAFCTVANQYRYGLAGKTVDLRQAYLLYLWDETTSGRDCSKNALTSMFKLGELAKVAPAYHQLWKAYAKLPSRQRVVEDLEQIDLRSEKKSGLQFSFSGYGGRVDVYADGIVVYKFFNDTTIDRWQATRSQMRELVTAIDGLKLEKKPMYLGMLYDDGYRWWFELSFSYQGQSKAIYGNNPSFTHKIYSIITQVFPNDYLLCVDDRKPCINQTLMKNKQ